MPAPGVTVEEDPLRGTRGSGSIFLSWRNLRCVFRQNREIRYKGTGEPVTPWELAYMMLNLPFRGCHHINSMDQYHPCDRVNECLSLNRALEPREYQQAQSKAQCFGLHRLDRR
jgi:uncharacterized Fe-S radical SAM superfamily protein PflX